MGEIGETKRVTIGGAGLAGSLLAVYLARRGFEVSVLERRPDLRRVELDAGRSINLALANRGIHALCGVDVMDRVEPLLTPMRGRMLHDLEGGLRLSPYGHRPHEVIYSVSRPGLTALLLDAAEETGRVSIEFGKNVRGVDLAKKVITVRDEATGEDSVRPYEVLIGADGSASKTRDAIVEATGGEFTLQPLEHSYKELTYHPAEDGGFRMEPGALHIWPRGGFMLIALPNVDRTFTVTLFLPAEGAEGFETLDTPEAVTTFFHRVFPDTLQHLPHLAEEFFENRTGRLATVRCRPWHYRGEALILGDAAHAIVPFHGQGMNCAFEDCAVLNDILDGGPATWEEAFAAFSERRKPDADAIADMALQNYVEMRDSVTDERFHLKKALGFSLEDRHPERFVPRYSMVMFHHVPYAEAMRRGVVNGQILDRLTEGIDEVEAVDFALADHLVREQLEPLQGLAPARTWGCAPDA